MNLDELVCGALESSFWAMDRKEREIYIGPTLEHASHQGHPDLFTLFGRPLPEAASAMNSTPFIIRCRQRSQAEQCQGNSL